MEINFKVFCIPLDTTSKNFAILYLFFIVNSYALAILKYLPMALVNKITLT